MNKHILKLATFLLDIKAGFRKTKAKTGFISSNISVIQKHTEAIETMASACDWTLLEMKPKYNKETNSMSQHMFYLGVVNSNECTSTEDFIL